MDYILKFKKEKEDKGYWNTSVFADTDEEAIAKVEELRKDGKHYKCKLGKIKYSFRSIYKWDE